MRVLLDACVPQPLRHDIAGHEVHTAAFAGLHHLVDTQLVEAADGHYDVLVTCDRSLPWQVSLAGRNLAVAVLCAPTNKLADLQATVPNLLAAVACAQPGTVTLVDRHGVSV